MLTQVIFHTTKHTDLTSLFSFLSVDNRQNSKFGEISEEISWIKIEPVVKHDVKLLITLFDVKILF